MKNNPLDDIVKCDIEISSPGSSDATFDSILLIVKAPAVGKDISRTISISKADELLDYGYTVDDEAYIAANVAFSQSPSPDSIYICVRKTVAVSALSEAEEGIGTDTDTESGTAGETESGTDAESGTGTDTNGSSSTTTAYEDLKLTLDRAAKECSFYGIHISSFRAAEDIVNVIEWTESNEKLFGFEYTDYNSFPVKNTNYYRSFAIYSGMADGYVEDKQPKENAYAALAWMAKCFGYDSGTETWNLKGLSTLVPSVLDTTMKRNLSEKRVNTFLRYAGANVTIGGYTLAGEWIDVIRFRDWLKNEMQVNVFNALKVNKKVPFTDNGIALIEGKMRETLLKGQTIGGIAPMEYDEEDMAVPGFTVTVPKASSLTEVERKSRKLTGCRYTARLAGAIHVVEIEGFLTF